MLAFTDSPTIAVAPPTNLPPCSLVLSTHLSHPAHPPSPPSKRPRLRSSQHLALPPIRSPRLPPPPRSPTRQSSLARRRASPAPNRSRTPSSTLLSLKPNPLSRTMFSTSTRTRNSVDRTLLPPPRRHLLIFLLEFLATPRMMDSTRISTSLPSRDQSPSGAVRLTYPRMSTTTRIHSPSSLLPLRVPRRPREETAVAEGGHNPCTAQSEDRCTTTTTTRKTTKEAVWPSSRG